MSSVEMGDGLPRSLPPLPLICPCPRCDGFRFINLLSTGLNQENLRLESCSSSYCWTIHNGNGAIWRLICDHRKPPKLLEQLNCQFYPDDGDRIQLRLLDAIARLAAIDGSARILQAHQLPRPQLPPQSLGE